MKKQLQTMLGVTLLEIMLVLAIASMVIVMSIRYYQSASMNQKISAGLNVVTGVLAAGESYLAATGDLSSVTSTTLQAYLPGSVMPSFSVGWASKCYWQLFDDVHDNDEYATRCVLSIVSFNS